MGAPLPPSPRRLARLVDELAEVGLDLGGTEPWHGLALRELDYALRPKIHERRVPSFGAFVAPTTDPAGWEAATDLAIERRPTGERSTDVARRYADGMSSWLIRRPGGDDEWAVFDRPAGSERDLVVLVDALGAVAVQRHPAGIVRVVGPFGVHRWDGIGWHHEPLVATWVDAVAAGGAQGDREVLETLLAFAVHDLGARNIGATLLYRADDGPGDDGLPAGVEGRLAAPPPLQVRRPADLAPLRHALAQVDGAAVFDRSGTLRQIGVRLVPSAEAEGGVDGYRGMRHTAGRRYSYDDPRATVVVVSEDGPVTVLRAGELIGHSAAPPPDDD
ncbi:MAG TPA: diadenylate cyclase [Acidimicrobiales bacterium]|nr:diadenylate cyclase [Acidimicrobiales bacterium]